MKKDRKTRYSDDGLPIDGRDWTEGDWRDLYECLERIKANVAARHACHYCKGRHPPQDWCSEKLAAWHKVSSK